MMSVGTSNFVRSSVKSVSEKALRHLGARPVGAVERRAEILEELGAVGEDIPADLVERIDRQAARIGRSFEHKWRHRSDQYSLGNAFRAVAADIAGDLAAAG